MTPATTVEDAKPLGSRLAACAAIFLQASTEAALFEGEDRDGGESGSEASFVALKLAMLGEGAAEDEDEGLRPCPPIDLLDVEADSMSRLLVVTSDAPLSLVEATTSRLSSGIGACPAAS